MFGKDDGLHDYYLDCLHGHHDRRGRHLGVPVIKCQ